MQEKLRSLPPIVAENAKVLILGSMPSRMSLEKQAYYGNPHNHFWGILYALFNQEPCETYDEKIAFIKQHQIALWDTIGTCFREGSLDSKITGEEPNDIIGLLKEQPTIRLIACNGTKSFQTFLKYFKGVNFAAIDVIKLPSTSPIPGRYTKSFAGKVEEWRSILAYL
ncbi:DNA-deoxyinosine glycosylase [Lentibacillus sp. Marseille-P4043]|uniref:DNA-deoxyinosine glycosylase n=1 Tax=Lentibacillus sp. Marseille-P4043 TaxID=2040293 RepID=UPI000D0B7D96|nr:DNA-deoxyinosine glycosylase [Lentibacillus sp. Marseille-P4043]